MTIFPKSKVVVCIVFSLWRPIQFLSVKGGKNPQIIRSYRKYSNLIKFNPIPKSNIKCFWKKQLTLTISLAYLLTERLWAREQYFLLVLCYWGKQSFKYSILPCMNQWRTHWSLDHTLNLYTHSILTPIVCASHLMVRHETHAVKVKVLWRVSPRKFLSISQH